MLADASYMWSLRLMIQLYTLHLRLTLSELQKKKHKVLINHSVKYEKFVYHTSLIEYLNLLAPELVILLLRDHGVDTTNRIWRTSPGGIEVPVRDLGSRFVLSTELGSIGHGCWRSSEKTTSRCTYTEECICIWFLERVFLSQEIRIFGMSCVCLS